MAAIALHRAILIGFLTFCDCQRHGSFEDQYMGCYQDSVDRALEFRQYKLYTGTNSNGKCIRECKAGNECYCGSRYDYGRLGLRQNECSIRCLRNIEETCGGNWFIQIYSVCPTGKYKGAGDAVINDKPNCENECHCKALPCLYSNGRCTDGCATGWKGHACNERDVAECEGARGIDYNQDCHKCINFTCECNQQYERTNSTCMDANECNGTKGVDYQQDCHDCVNTNGNYYTCECRAGYELDQGTNQTCIDIVECDGTKGVEYDHNCHTCLNTIGSYTCECRAGFELDPITNQTCIDVVECDGIRGVDYDRNCDTCINIDGSYTCECRDGYELDPSTQQKCIDIDECEATKGRDYDQDCHKCVNLIGRYTCICDENYKLDPGTNKTCIDINECLGERGVDYDHNCHICTNTKGSYTCDCAKGYGLHPNGESCVDHSKHSSAYTSITVIMGIIVILLFLFTTIFAVRFLTRKQRRGENNTATVLSAIAREPAEYLELLGLVAHVKYIPVHANNDSPQIHSKQFSDPEILHQREYDDIGVAALKQTPGATSGNTPETHYIAMDSPKKHTNPTVSQSDKPKPKATLSKTTKTMANTSDEKLGFAQVDGFRGKWSFLAFQCPKGSDAVEKFWKLVNDRKIQSVVLLEDVSSKVLPAVESVGSFNDIKVICKEEWQKRGIKKFTVTLNDEQLCEEAEFANKGGICVLTVDHKLTNKDIISLRQNLISSERSPTCAIMCKDGQQFSGFFISVNCMLDMADEGNKIDIVQGLQQFKNVRPDFAPTDEQILLLSHLAKDYGSYGKELK
ncbi:hypothetical protein CAPTEDRAFT_189199 [Capitella teleta]|uniref:Uncharacterized protein n=1 Tax=Capitella teleta TaxID=283909 RepID=R7VE21_CAPTE|nr:hypothetical protein CAPTEDRAFT_189199 [Capitella teleta]|eukprot:ELU16874.1 hypothetical protein CAPTEDRAFT_189199 [Capitella teleta]